MVKRSSIDGKKYEIFKRQDPQAANAWCAHCKANTIPYILIETYAQRAEIRFDSISMSPELYEHVFKQMDTITKEAKLIFKKYSDKRSNFAPEDQLIYFEDMPRKTAELAACELFDLILLSIQNPVD